MAIRFTPYSNFQNFLFVIIDIHSKYRPLYDSLN